ncbi:hypothetical protein GW891_05615, partial [bacterium]|nr:hypothetical protein [bacterium]
FRLNSQTKLFQYFLLYLVETNISKIQSMINTITLLTALSNQYHISYKNIFNNTSVSKYNQIVLSFILSLLIHLISR